ncbi:MAG TPA: sulfotransferase [Solirubrobacteraceae bacterium]|nr:sulfotransferase [Solirubrobacteraceae bacterium]
MGDLRLIGAGLPRTATTTQLFALEQLGQGPCYHMRDLLADLERGLPLWERASRGEPDWEATFGDARSAVDWPSARYYRELMDQYPDAKVLLSVRDGEEWVRSMRQTVWGVFHGDTVLHHLCEVRAELDPPWARFMALMRYMTWDQETGALAGETFSDEGLAAVMDRWNDEVKRTVPADRLLVWYPNEGWEPLCAFLGMDVPQEELPRLNDAQSFREGIIGGALGVVNEWWEARERPASGLHGAALS